MERSIWMVACLCAGASLADDNTMTSTDASNFSSFNSGHRWANGLAPAPGNRYFTGAFQMRTPTNSSTAESFVFLGDQLTISSGGSMLWKTQGSLRVDDLVMDGGALTHGLDNFTGRLFGTVTVARASAISANEPNSRTFMVYSTVKGPGNLTVSMNQTNSLKQTSFLSDNSGFTGRIILVGQGKLGVCVEEALGAPPAAFVANQLEFNGGTLILTNSLTIDDPGRGFALNNTSNPGSNIYPGGVVEVSGASVTATVACVISGAGPLTKRGAGTLILATNNTYTGQTTVEGGTLRLAPDALYGVPSMVVSGSTAAVSGEGSLSNLTLAAGGRLAAEKSGWSVKSLAVLNTTNVTFAIDLSQAAPTAAMIRVGGAISKQPLQVFQFTVNTNGTTETPYPILSASNLADFASYDFCVTPPWIGELSRTNDAGGGQVLLFTPTPSEKRAFLTATDTINTTSFVDATKWSDGLSPTNPPTGVKTYVSTGYSLRTPYNRTMTFGGKRLVMSGQAIALKGSAYIPTVTDLTLMEDASLSMSEPTRCNMAGSILLRKAFDAGKTYGMRVTSNDAGRDLFLHALLSGYGDLFLQAYGNPAYSNNIYNLLALNTNFYGKVYVDGHTNFWVRIRDEQNLGANPPLFRADQLRFNGGGISVTNSVTLDDSNRGITLLGTGGTSATDDNVGGFPTGTPAADRVYPGGCVLRPEGANTLTILCPIAGAGSLAKNGAGLLVLGGSNTYTGQTQIIAGRVLPISTNALGAGPLLLKPEGRLVRRYPSPALPNGVELGAGVTFEAGSKLVIEWSEGFAASGNFMVPLFTVPSGTPVDTASIALQYSLKNYVSAITSSTVGGSTAYSARFAFTGSVMLIE